MRYPLVVFDFDGTLADSFAASVALFERLAPGLGLRPVPDLEAARSLPTRQLLRRMGVRFWQVPRFVRTFQAGAAEYANRLKLHAGVPELLATLQGRGHRLGVLSSNRADAIRACLAANGVEHRFAFVVGCPKLFGKAKALRRIVRAERLTPGRAVYVGDELRDLDAGRQARVSTVAATWGFHTEALLRTAGPTWVARTPADVVAALADG